MTRRNDDRRHLGRVRVEGVQGRDPSHQMDDRAHVCFLSLRTHLAGPSHALANDALNGECRDETLIFDVSTHMNI